MRQDSWLLCGPLAAVVLAGGIATLPLLVPGYSPVRETGSEIGEVGSPARVPFSIMPASVAVPVLSFALAVYRISATRGHGPIGAWLAGILAILSAGLALCPFPHPLHNFFGTSKLIVYQAPLVFALQWRKDPQGAKLASFSWLCFAILWASLALDFVIFFRNGSLRRSVRPVYSSSARSFSDHVSGSWEPACGFGR
jgi:hypothetical protein